MRALLLMVCVAACSSPDGTYLVFHSADDRIEFDRIQVVFGKDNGHVVSTPEHPAGSTESQLVIVPTLLDQPIQLSSPTTRLDYLLSDVQQTQQLGRYALAVAFRGDVAVGIGDVFDFKVKTDGVYLYDVTLFPYASEDVELYGRPTQDCLRWSRSDPASSRGPATIAIVRESDPDCDDFVGMADCDEGLYCDPSSGNTSGCVSTNACITDTPFCQYGNCVNGMDGRRCEPTTCMLAYVCNGCEETQSPDSFFTCGLTVMHDHPEVYIPTQPDGTMCTQGPYTFSFELPDLLRCANPRLESSTSEDDYQFTIDADPASGKCVVTATPPSPTRPLNANSNHLLISIDAPNRLLPRTTLIVGLNPATPATPTTCAQPSSIVVWDLSSGPPASACTPQL